MIKIHQHQIQTFLNCREQFYLSEILCLVPRISRKELNLGSAFHSGVRAYKEGYDTEQCLALSNLYFEQLTPSTQEEQNQIIIGKQTVTAMLMGYFNKYQQMPKMISVEKKISATIGKIKLIGTPDNIEVDDNGEYWIGEEKTTSRLEEDYVNRLPLDFQMTFYFLLAEKSYHKKFSGINYRISRVTSIQLKKKQTLEAYLKEIANDYIERPNWYYVNEKLYRSRKDIDQFKDWLVMIVNDLTRCVKEKRWYANTSRCTNMNCWYRKYCQDRSPENMQIFLKETEDKSKCFSVMNNI